jgi:TfdA family taurine catabolism dioxygenase TauD
MPATKNLPEKTPMSSLSGKQGPRYRHLADETEPYETIAIEKLTPIIGAEISGVDISKLVSDDARSNRQIDEIHRALAENLVIFFRDQHITPQQHLASSAICIFIPPPPMRATIRR